MGKLNTNWINICFVIDKSGSMYQSKEDVISGFQKIIDEQKANKNGKVTVSLFTFNQNVSKEYIGVDINEVDKFHYSPDGLTAMNDGICTAIDEVGKWLYEKDKNGEEMPAKTMVIVMTDGLENASKEYTLKQTKDKIAEQSSKYSWEFIYQGVDITTTKSADELGFKYKTYSSRTNLGKNYDVINCVTTSYRKLASAGATMDSLNETFALELDAASTKNTLDFEKEIGKKLTNE